MSTVVPPSATAETRIFNVALIGNPNTGKSTVFNALAGLQSRVGNFPGCTVEKKMGRVTWDGCRINLVDLPGTYSLSPRSQDEMVSVDVLLGRQSDVGDIDAVVCIVDASNLERNLYLVSQVLDMGLPTVLVLNMFDVLAKRGISIETERLEQALGIPVVSTEAHRNSGISEVKSAIVQAAKAAAPSSRPKPFPQEFYDECDLLRQKLTEWGEPELPFFLLERLLIDVGGHVESYFAHRHTNGLQGVLAESRERLNAAGCRVPAMEARTRYGWARKVLQGVVTLPTERPTTASDKIDQFLTHRVVGLLFFAALMFVVFQAIYTWAGPVMDACEAGQEWVAGLITGMIPPGAFRSLLVDGVVAGVGGVLVFLPQIVFLFFFIAILEDCGYMARAAFLMDKLMTKIGLSGKSFVPLMSSFACAIPGVMATRVIENRRDRMLTILIAPLMSCSARLPVYLLLIAAFIPEVAYLGGWIGLQGLVLFAMSSLGALIAIPVAWILKKTFFKGETPPFVMELPTYKWPSARIVLLRVYDRGKAFVTRAGTLIFATTIVVWAAGYFPGNHTEQNKLQVEIEALEGEFSTEISAHQELEEQQDLLSQLLLSDEKLPLKSQYMFLKESPAQARSRIEKEVIEASLVESTEPEEVRSKLELNEAEIQSLEVSLRPIEQAKEARNHINGELIAYSFLGRIGHAIEPAVKPLGWDWKIGVGAIASFPAREVIIATLGTIYSLGADVDEEDEGLKGAMKASEWPDGTKVYNIPVALSIMVFFALCAQCGATLMVIKRETNNWSWPIFTFVYMTSLAYVAALITYQVGIRLV